MPSVQPTWPGPAAAAGSTLPAGRNTDCTERPGLLSHFQPPWPAAATPGSRHREWPEALLAGRHTGSGPRLCWPARPPCAVGRRYCSKGTVRNSNGYATLDGTFNLASDASSVRLLPAQVPLVSKAADTWGCGSRGHLGPDKASHRPR